MSDQGGSGGVRVRNLTPGETSRFMECLRWIQAPRRDGEPEDEIERARLRLEEARKRWPDVAALVGFAEDR